MPAQMQFFDMNSSASLPQAASIPIPVAVGPNFQQNDYRLFFQAYAASGNYFGGLQVPPGYTVSSSETGNAGTVNLSVSWRLMVEGDTDTFVQYVNFGDAVSYDFTDFWYALLTVRGVNPYVSPTAGLMSNNAILAPSLGTPGPSTIQFPSLSVSGAGTLVIWLTSYSSSGSGSTTASEQTASAIGCPTTITGLTFTNLVATQSSGSTFYPYNNNDSSAVFGMYFSGAGSTGIINVPYSASNVPAFNGYWVFLPVAPDVSATAGSVTVGSSATAASGSTTSTVVATTGSASETCSVGTAFNPLTGYFLSDPLPMTLLPVTGSVVRWNADTPGSSSVTVETSINNGASWDLASNDQPIPRLREGDTATQTVLARITLTRTEAPSLFPSPSLYPGSSLYPIGSSPTVHSFEMAVSSDASVDELVPIGYGMIDGVTTHATGGTTGAGSSTNVAGSTAVTARGGGQTGGGVALKIHANDMSYAIKRNVWQQPYFVPSGTLYTDAIKAMVLDRLPDQELFNLTTTTDTTPLLVYGAQQGGDPWQDIQELAQAIGYEAFFDASGVFVCRPVPDPRAGDPVWAFDETAVQLVAEAQRDLSSEQTFNDIVIVGQSTSSANPFAAESYDDDSASPTYILGPYGRVTQRLTFSLITSQAQAQSMANAALYSSLGSADTVTLTNVPMPALEPGDIVKVVCSDVKASGTYLINSMTTPLAPSDPQSLTCFTQSTNLQPLGSNPGLSAPTPAPVPSPTPPGPGLAISTVGSFQSTTSSGSSLPTSWPVTTTTVGNCVVLWAVTCTPLGGFTRNSANALIPSTFDTFVNVSGGNITNCSQIGKMAYNWTTDGAGASWIYAVSAYFGMVTANGSAAVTLGTTGIAPGGSLAWWLGAQEFTASGADSSISWELDSYLAGSSMAAYLAGQSVFGTSISFTSLTPSNTNRLYMGASLWFTGGSASSETTGYTLKTASVNTPSTSGPVTGFGGALWDTSVPVTAQAPTITLSGASSSWANVCALIYAHNADA